MRNLSYKAQKNAIAVALCSQGHGLVKVNGVPVELIEPAVLRTKVWEPILVLGKEKFAEVDIRVRVKGGGSTSQVYGLPALVCLLSRASHPPGDC